jgi:hypothetical protein
MFRCISMSTPDCIRVLILCKEDHTYRLRCRKVDLSSCRSLFGPMSEGKCGVVAQNLCVNNIKRSIRILISGENKESKFS